MEWAGLLCRAHASTKRSKRRPLTARGPILHCSHPLLLLPSRLRISGTKRSENPAMKPQTIALLYSAAPFGLQFLTTLTKSAHLSTTQWNSGKTPPLSRPAANTTYMTAAPIIPTKAGTNEYATTYTFVLRNSSTYCFRGKTSWNEYKRLRLLTNPPSAPDTITTTMIEGPEPVRSR